MQTAAYTICGQCFFKISACGHWDGDKAVPGLCTDRYSVSERQFAWYRQITQIEVGYM
jgi:hypothetical protein